MEEGHTKERLRALQALPLERKIGFTIARIVEWHTHYNGKVYVSFSGGKDSTVLLDIARGLFPDIKAMFVDTGLEYPEIREFVKTFDNVDIIRPKMSFKQVIETYGYPVVGKEVAECVEYARISPSEYRYTRLQKLNGELKDKNGNPSRWNFQKYRYLLDAPFKISNRCCSVMKKAPANAYTKSTGMYPIIATMADESFCVNLLGLDKDATHLTQSTLSLRRCLSGRNRMCYSILNSRTYRSLLYMGVLRLTIRVDYIQLDAQGLVAYSASLVSDKTNLKTVFSDWHLHTQNCMITA